MTAQFSVETVAASGQIRGQLSLALDARGTPHIAYTTQLGDVMLARRDAGGWTHEHSPTGAIAEADDGRVCLAIDSQGHPHIAYRDRDSGHLIYGVRHDTWILESVPTQADVFPRGVMHPSLQLHPGHVDAALRDTSHFAFHDAFHPALSHATKVGGTWRDHVTVVDDATFRVVGLYPALAFDGNDVLRIAYVEQLDQGGPTSQKLKLATLIPAGTPRPDGTLHPGGWDRRVIDDDNIVGEFVSMARGTRGCTFIAYFDSASGSLNAWVENPVQHPEPRKETVATGISRAVPSAADRLSGQPGPTGALRIAYTDGQLKFATRDDTGTWNIQVVDAVGAWPSLAYDAAGTAHLAYLGDGGLKYAQGTE